MDSYVIPLREKYEDILLQVTTTHRVMSLGFLETFVCAITFTYFQFEEYRNAPFSISDSIYGTTFYIITGLHGVHVIIGTIFLFITYCCYNLYHFNSKEHLGFEFAVWYWHFVDVVWLYVFTIIYCWSWVRVPI